MPELNPRNSTYLNFWIESKEVRQYLHLKKKTNYTTTGSVKTLIKSSLFPTLSFRCEAILGAFVYKYIFSSTNTVWFKHADQRANDCNGPV